MIEALAMLERIPSVERRVVPVLCRVCRRDDRCRFRPGWLGDRWCRSLDAAAVQLAAMKEACSYQRSNLVEGTGMERDAGAQKPVAGAAHHCAEGGRRSDAEI